MCLCCGHDGTELQGQLAATSFICPACGADLYARPPRTYAEMEGLVARVSGPAPTTFDRLSRLLVSTVEHHAVLDAATWLGERGLADVDVFYVLSEVEARGLLYAVAAVAEVDVVQVQVEDLVLALATCEGNRQQDLFRFT